MFVFYSSHVCSGKNISNQIRIYLTKIEDKERLRPDTHERLVRKDHDSFQVATVTDLIGHSS